MKNKKLGFVLLPGGGMSSWVWEWIAPGLKLPHIALDRRIEINDYPHRKNAVMDDCVNYIISCIDQAPFDSCILVGHSGAGALAASVAKRISEKIIQVVYIAANIPPHGSTMMSGLPLPLRLLNIVAVRKMIKRDSMPYVKIEKTLRDKFCNTCDEDAIQFVLSHDLQSEPLCVLSAKMDWTDFPGVPQTYVLLGSDRTISVERQREMAGHLGITDFREIDAGHMVMLSHPSELTGLLNGIAAGNENDAGAI